jgi:RNA polymerase sigma-70 factor (ECF subfamily)
VGTDQGQAPGRPGTTCDPEGFERYRRPLRAYAYARVGDWETAEDLAQETVIRALQSPQAPHDPREIPHYLRRILKNLCINFARDSHPTLSLQLISESDDGAGQSGSALSQLVAQAAEQEFLDEDARQRILEAIAALPQHLREVLVLRCVEGLSYAEIGHLLDLKTKAVDYRLYTARQLLAEELEMGIEESTRGPLSCRQCRRLLSPFIDGELEFPQVRRVHQHLHECERCTEELERVCEQMRQVDLAVASPTNSERIAYHSSPRVWHKAWQLMAERIDDIARDDRQTVGAITALSVVGLDAEQSDLLLRLAQACVEANPDSPKAFCALGRVHIRRNDYQAAQAVYERAIELARRSADPRQAQSLQASAFSGLAWVWSHLASRAQAAGDREAFTAAAERLVEYGRQARDLDTGSEAYKQGMVMDGLAKLGREQETLEEIQRYLRTMEAAGKHPVYGKIASALHLFGRREEALEYLQRGAAAVPLDTGKLLSLSTYCELLDQPEEAAFWAARAQAVRKTSGRQTQPWLAPA